MGKLETIAEKVNNIVILSSILWADEPTAKEVFGLTKSETRVLKDVYLLLEVLGKTEIPVRLMYYVMCVSDKGASEKSGVSRTITCLEKRELLERTWKRVRNNRRGYFFVKLTKGGAEMAKDITEMEDEKLARLLDMAGHAAGATSYGSTRRYLAKR